MSKWRERALAEAEALNSISAAVAQSLELKQALGLALRRIAQVMRVDLAWVYLIDEKTQELVFAAQHGFSEELLEGANRLKLGEGLNGRVAQSGAPLTVENIPEDPRLTREVAKSEGAGVLGRASPIQRYGHWDSWCWHVLSSPLHAG